MALKNRFEINIFMSETVSVYVWKVFFSDKLGYHVTIDNHISIFCLPLWYVGLFKIKKKTQKFKIKFGKKKRKDVRHYICLKFLHLS